MAHPGTAYPQPHPASCPVPVPAHFGPWRFDAEWLTLTHPAIDYEIDLERLTTSAQVLDVLCQVALKPWGDPATVQGLLCAIITLLNPQAHLCSLGVERGPMVPRTIVHSRLPRPARREGEPR